MMYRSNFGLNEKRVIQNCTHRIENLYHENMKSDSKIALYSLNSINCIKFITFIWFFVLFVIIYSYMMRYERYFENEA